MRVAVAGGGDVAKYLIEELLSASHTVVFLTRSSKPWFDRPDITTRKTDYSVASLVEVLRDCDALVSTVFDFTMDHATVHLAMLEACKQSSSCKRFMPTEFGGNLDDFPEYPVFYFENHTPVRRALKEQNEIMYTLFNVGWFSDYIIPSEQRYLRDAGPFHPVDFHTGIMTIPGNGDNLLSFIPARDAAKAVAKLVDQDGWEETTYVTGELTTWNKIGDLLERHGKKLERRYLSSDDLGEMLKSKDPEELVVGQFHEFTTVGAGVLPQEKAKRQKEKFFKDLKFRTNEEFIVDAQRNPNSVI